MNMPDAPQRLNTYLDTHFTCDCGREHYASLKFVSIRKNALEALKEARAQGVGGEVLAFVW